MYCRRIRLSTIAFILFAVCIVICGCRQTSKAAIVRSKHLAQVSSVPATRATIRPELVLQYSHSQRTLDISFATKAPVFASSDGGGHIDIWNSNTWIIERSIDINTKSSDRNYNTKAISLSPDGTALAYMTGNGEVQIWDVNSGNMKKRLPHPVGLPVNIAWSPNGKMIAAGSTETVGIWDAISGSLIRTLPGSGDVAFSSDGKILGTAGENDAFLFDIATGKKNCSFHDKAGISGPIAISPDGRLVATAGEDPNWDPGPLPRDEEGNEYAPSESFYAHELKVKIWDRRTGKRKKMLSGHHNLAGGTKVLQFAPDSRRLFSGGDGVVSLWDVQTGKAIRQFNNGGPSALSPDGKMIAVTMDYLSVFSVSTGKNILNLHAPASSIHALAFSPDGKLLAAGDQLRGPTGLRLWDVENGRLSRALQGPPAGLHDVGFLPNKKVFSNSLNGTYIWNTDTGKLLRKLQGPKVNTFFDGEQRVWALLTPDGSRTIVQFSDFTSLILKIQDTTTGKLVSTISTGNMGSLSRSVFSPDGKYIALPEINRSQEDLITIWDINSGQMVSKLEAKIEGAVLLTFSPDGNTIAGSMPSPVQMPANTLVTDNKIAVWDTTSGRQKRQIILGKDAAGILAFSPDGKTIAAAIGDQIIFYDAESLKEIKRLSSGLDVVNAIAYSPNGHRIAAGDEKGHIRIWDVMSNKLLLTMIGFTSPNGEFVSPDWIAYTPNGFYDWSEGAAKLIRWRLDGKSYPANAFAKEIRRKNLLKQAVTDKP